MEPTLSPGSRVLVRRCRPGAVRRGTVVVVAPPPSGEPAADPSLARLVKRVAALPGDAMPVGVGGPDSSRRVPRGRLVLLGDNASRSLDSRQLGCFRTDDVLGVVVRVLAR